MIWRNIAMVKNHVDEYHEPYQTALKSFIKDYKAAEGDAEKENKAIDKFAEKYTVISYIWYLYNKGLNSFEGDEEDVLKRRMEIKLKHLSHLYDHLWFITYSEDEEENGKFFQKLLDTSYSAIDIRQWNEKTILQKLKLIEKLKQNLSFPNSSLENSYKEYIKLTPDTEEEMEKVKIQFESLNNLFEKIMYKENDEWWTNVKETNDINFIIQNTEFRIGNKPQNKKMWNLYLEYLKQHNLIDIMLDVYSRYCRFFIVDKKMFKKYKSEIENAANLSEKNVKKWQLDAIKFEKDFNSIEAALSLYKKLFGETETLRIIEANNFDEIMKKLLLEIPKGPSNLKYVVKDDEVKLVRKSQPMFFRSPTKMEHIYPLTIINYILKKLNPNLLEKLYKTSKYFYTLFEINICSMLDISDQYPSTVTYKNGLFYSGNDPREIKKLYLTSKLFVNDKNHSALSSMVPKIYKSQISAMFLFHQNLTVKELLFLGSNVSKLLFNDTKVVCEKNQEIYSVPELIELLSNLEVAEFYDLQYPAFPFDKEEKVNGFNKLIKFKAKNFMGPFDLNFLCNFIENNDEPEAHFGIISNFIENEFNAINEIIKANFDHWESNNMKRSFKIGILGVRTIHY